jgi:hypothetical protein
MVKVLRPLLPKGLKDNFAHHLLRKAFRDETVDRLLLNLELGLETDEPRYFQGSQEKAETETAEWTNSNDGNWIQNDNDDEEDSEDEYEDDPFVRMRDTLEEAEDTHEGEAAGVEPSPLLFRRYSTLAIVESYFTLGVPISVVLTNQTGPQRMGVIVATCNEWWLLPLRVGQMQYDDELGFTYFQVSLYPKDSQMLVRTKVDGENPKYNVQLLNYATLLPALWLETPLPYALMTTEGDHLNANFDFV